MNISIFVTLLVMAVFGLSACQVKDPDEANKNLRAQLEKDKRQNDDLLKTLMKGMEQGGQPGSIKISGVIVKDNSKTDVRITVLAKAGIGKDGTEAKIADVNQPVLSSKNEKLDISKISEDKKLISVGCDEKLVAEYAKERSLEVHKLPEPIEKSILIVSAKTIMLCGKVNGIDGLYVTFQADELILNTVDYSQIGWSGWSVFNSNKLVLLGSNKLETKVPPASYIWPRRWS